MTACRAPLSCTFPARVVGLGYGLRVGTEGFAECGRCGIRAHLTGRDDEAPADVTYTLPAAPTAISPATCQGRADRVGGGVIAGHQDRSPPPLVASDGDGERMADVPGARKVLSEILAGAPDGDG